MISWLQTQRRPCQSHAWNIFCSITFPISETWRYDMQWWSGHARALLSPSIISRKLLLRKVGLQLLSHTSGGLVGDGTGWSSVSQICYSSDFAGDVNFSASKSSRQLPKACNSWETQNRNNPDMIATTKLMKDTKWQGRKYFTVAGHLVHLSHHQLLRAYRRPGPLCCSMRWEFGSLACGEDQWPRNNWNLYMAIKF